MDLAVTEDESSTAHQLSLFLQRPDGSLGPPVRMTLPEEFGGPLPVAFADLDGDGVGEILVGGSHLLVVRHAGGVLIQIDSKPARYGCAYIAVGDIDSDGESDVVCHSGLGTPSSATLFFGNGAEGFRSTVDMLTDVGSYGSYPGFEALQLADVTGDGRPDLIVTSSKVNSFYVYVNNGTGGFWPGTSYPHPWSPTGIWPSALQVIDLDGDGINEVVTASPDNQPDAKLNVYRLNTTGYLSLSERLPTYDSTTALVSADLDGDGDAELLAGHYYFNAVSVLGVAAAGLANPGRYELPGFGDYMDHISMPIGSAKSFALGDIDGDGCPDLASATYSGVILLYGCEPSWKTQPVSDFDGDGVSDLLWSQPFGEYTIWAWADGDGGWRGCAYFQIGCYYKLPPWKIQASGDFNGDGHSDEFWRNPDTGENAILLSAYFERAVTGVSNQDWQVVGVGDFDGDDQSDLLWRNQRTGANAIWRSGDYKKQQATRTVADVNWQVVGVGDFNGDGQSDILWRHATTGRNAVWLSGRFDSQQAMIGVSNLRWSVRGIGDFDGDGKDDVVWRNADTGAGAIWLSANYRTQQGIVAVTNLDWTIGAVGDYNGDGYSDLFWRNGRTGANVIWRSADFGKQQAVMKVDPSWEWQLVQ